MRQDRLAEKAEQRREQEEQAAQRQAILDDMRAQVAPQVDIDPARLVQARIIELFGFYRNSYREINLKKFKMIQN